jgi:hypothetical protein
VCSLSTIPQHDSGEVIWKDQRPFDGELPIVD